MEELMWVDVLLFCQYLVAPENADENKFIRCCLLSV